jgi:Na+/proline symporter
MEVTVILSWLFILVIGYLCGKWASKKGYNFWAWFFGGSVLGAVVIACLPDVNKLEESKREKQVYIGNTIGIVMAVIAFFLGFMTNFPK